MVMFEKILFHLDDVGIFPGPANWANYLINNDTSSISEYEKSLADAWINFLKPFTDIIDISGEPYFSWKYNQYSGDNKINGGMLVDYVIRKTS